MKKILNYVIREPKYFKPRPVQFAIRNLIEEEFNKLEKDGILEKVENSD